jgi:N-acetylneuraminic acid mutarotase
MKLFLIAALSLSLAAAAPKRSRGYETVIAGKLPTGREHSTAFYDGQDSIFIMGGYDGLNLYDEVLQFDLHGAINKVGHFPTGITDGSVGTDGKGGFYYFGGDDGTLSAEIYHITAENPNPTVIGSMPIMNRLQASASDKNGNIYICGGLTLRNIEERKNIIKYDTKTRMSSMVGKLPIGLYGASAAMVGESVFIFGGMNDEGIYSSNIFEFIPSTGEVKVLETEMVAGGSLYSSAVIVGSEIWIVGGLSSTQDKAHHITKFDTIMKTTQYMEIENWDETHSGLTAVYVPKMSRIYMVGGFTFVNERIQHLGEISYIQLQVIH